MANLIPSVRGPKLPPFNGDIANAQFVKYLNSGDESEGHARVFQVLVNKQKFVVKIFKFVALDDIRPGVLMEEHHISDNVLRHHSDPFFAECRAFGHLVKNKKDHTLAVRCHGYVHVPESVERRIEKDFGIHDWNRGPKDSKEPLRAIVKDYIKYKSFYKPSNFTIMREKLVELNNMGIYNMDVCEENYLGGRLFDFSLAITMPHFSFSVDVRTQGQILEDTRFDLACFDSMAKSVVEQSSLAKKKRWAGTRIIARDALSPKANLASAERPKAASGRTRRATSTKGAPKKGYSKK